MTLRGVTPSVGTSDSLRTFPLVPLGNQPSPRDSAMPRYTDAEQELFDNPDTMPAICDHVAGGGTLQGLTDDWNRRLRSLPEIERTRGFIRFGMVWGWVCASEVRFNLWKASTERIAEADEARIKGLYRAIAFSDIRDLFDAKGNIRDTSEWPAELAMMVQGLDVAEMFDRGEEGKEQLIGLLKKVKLADRLKAADLLAAISGLNVSKHEVKGAVTLENLVSSVPVAKVVSDSE